MIMSNDGVRGRGGVSSAFSFLGVGEFLFLLFLILIIYCYSTFAVYSFLPCTRSLGPVLRDRNHSLPNVCILGSFLLLLSYSKYKIVCDHLPGLFVYGVQFFFCQTVAQLLYNNKLDFWDPLPLLLPSLVFLRFYSILLLQYPHSRNLI